MIRERYIREWNEFVPWKDMLMVEQDLIICRALVSIFSDEFLRENLAFRGGTALHKLFLQPQPRYSEDIDLVQIKPGPIKPIMFRLGEVLECYRKYIEFVVDRAPSYKEFVQNMELKMQDEEFLEDVTPLLRPEISFDPHVAYPLVYEKLIDRMPGKRD